MTSTRTHYEVLGIDRSADAAAIRRAWKVLIQVWHPDRFNGDLRDEAERMTARINEAHQELRDASRRAAYDRRLDDAGAGSGGRSDAAPRGPRAHAPAGASPFTARATAGAGGASARAATVVVAEPEPLVDVIARFGREIWAAACRYPRVSAVVAAVWLLVFGSAAASSLTHRAPLPQPRSDASLRLAAAGDAVASVDEDVFPTPDEATDGDGGDATDVPAGPEVGAGAGADGGGYAGPGAYADPGMYAAPGPVPPPRRVIRVQPRRR